MINAAFICDNPRKLHAVYSPAVIQELRTFISLDETVWSRDAALQNPSAFVDTEVLFSTWGMPAFTEDEIRRCFPKVKCLFYAAGTVQAFARPFLACGVRVFSAWAAYAVPVADYAVAQIILANKSYFRLSHVMKADHPAAAKALTATVVGNYGADVGLIGCGMIGSLTAQMLQRYRLHVWAYDPFLSDDRAAALGVTRCTLDELFARCRVVSNHLANNAQTRGMLQYHHFASMPENAVFLNTGRGAQVVEADLVRVLTERPDLTAVLDVTYPEPPDPGHAFYTLPNCILTPHIAGSLGDEVVRMAEYMLAECRAWLSGRPVQYEVTEAMLATMA